MSQPPPDFLVVGIGASAGGVEALQTFFAHVPVGAGIAYVVILHLSPDHESQLAAVLQAVTPLPVSVVTRRVRVEPGHVYVVPPSQHLTMDDGDLRVVPNALPDDRRAPIDLFFRTLADSHDGRAVCVVLSGMGSDGSMGLKRVKERGGVVFVQNPREAAFNEMPRSAIATDLVDAVLPVAAIPAQISAYQASLGAISIPEEPEQRPEEQQQALRELFAQLRTRTGHDFSNYKRPTLLRRISRRISVRNLPDLPAYVAFLRDNPEEVQALLKDLLISVTNFFRDQAAFAALEQEVLPRIFQGRRADEQIRVWAVGCATGEEAYSLAMLCAERTLDLLDSPAIQVFATDIDEAAIAHAREGIYTASETVDLSPERLRRFFTREDDHYRIRRELREMVLFATHNILKDPPFSHIDLVTCRNLLIYLNQTAQERVLETLHFALKPGGYLFLGSSESVDGAGDLYATVSREHHIFQRRSIGPRPLPVPDSAPLARVAQPRSAPISIEAGERTRERISYGELHQRLLEQYAPPSVVVNQDYDIVHLSERAGRYLQITGGEITNNLLTLIRPELRLELRTALYQAMQRQTNVDAANLPISVEGRTELVTVHVRPVLRHDDPAQGFLLVLFDPSPAPAGDAEVVVRTDEPMARQLEEEVSRLKQQLRSSSEQYEFQAEELRATNEELQALNEELRSSAEELETSKEELQSINEELRTVNQELKVKVEEATLHSTNLQNLVNSTDIGTIFLDRSLRVKLFTPSARALFNLIPADYGRPLSDLTHRLLDIDVSAEAERVLATLTTVEREVGATNGGVYVLRVLPYRAGEDRIGGVVLTFFDITERKRAEQILRANEERQTFLLQLDDRLRPLADPVEIQFEAACALGEHLGADRVMYGEVEGEDDEAFIVRRDYRLPHMPSAARRHRFDDYGASAPAALRAGRTLVVADVHALEEQTAAERAAYAALDIGAHVTVPLVKSGRIVACLAVNQRTPRQWKPLEVALVEEVAERIAATVERARTEAALRESEARFRTLADAVPQVIWANDAEGRAIYFNQRWYAYTGLSYDQSAGPGWQVIVHPDDEPPSVERWERALAAGKPFDAEYRLRRADGLYRWHLGRNVPLRDDAGRVVGWFGSATDIEDLKQAEAARQESEERFRLLVEGARDYAMFLLDAANRITFWSVGAERVFGWGEAEALGQPGAIIFTPEDRAAGQPEREVRTALAAGSALNRRWHLRKDGGRLFLDGSLIRLDDPDGRPRGFVKIGRDATAQRLAEEAVERANAELEARVNERTAALVASNQSRQELLRQLVSSQEEERLRIARDLHDQMGQQIAGLLLGLKQLEQRAAGGPLAELLPPIQALALDLAREAHRLAVGLRPTALDDVGLLPALERMVADWAAQAEVAAGFHSAGFEGGRLPLTLETTLYRAVQEALTNVRKHAGASTVSVLLERRAGEVVAIVEDNGRGYDPDAPELAGDRPRLGLRGMRERIEQIGGALEIESSPGSGTTLYIRVPLGPPDP